MSRGAYHQKRRGDHIPPRLDAILRALGGGRIVLVGDLAKELNVIERTLRRDLSMLREMGHRIDSSPGPGGGVMLRQQEQRP